MKLITNLTVYESWDASSIKNEAESLFGEIKAFVEIQTALTFYFDDSKTPWIVARAFYGLIEEGQCVTQCGLEAFLRKWCQMFVKKCQESIDISLYSCIDVRIEIADKGPCGGLQIVCFDIRSEDEILEELHIFPCVKDCLSNEQEGGAE